MKKVSFIFQVVLAALLLFSCASGPIVQLTGDSVSGPPEGSAVFLMDVEIVFHPSVVFKGPERLSPAVRFEQVDDGGLTAVSLYGRKMNFWSGKRDNPWTLDGDVYRLSYTVSAEAALGEYRIADVDFVYGSTTSQGYKSTTTTTYSQHFYANAGFRVKESGVYYIGKLFLEITDVTGTFPDYAFTSRLSMEQDEKKMAACFAAFSTERPKTAAAFGNKVEAPSLYYSYLLDFSYDTQPARTAPWRSSINENVNYLYQRGKFELEKKVVDQSYYFMKNTKQVFVPGNCDIEWTSIFSEGEADQGAGLMLGADQANCYFFTLLPDGRVGIGELRNNEWQKNIAPFDQYGGYSLADGRENRHRLEKRGAATTYYVNGAKVARFADRYPGEFPMIAFFISGKGKVFFDDFGVRETTGE